jgi:4-hydroxythreonine-4-phosphate dehydrogenase
MQADRPAKAKPVLGIILGDHAGIGPEIVAKSLMDGRLVYTPVVVGSRALFEDARRRYAPELALRPYHAAESLSRPADADITDEERAVYVLDVGSGAGVTPGEVSAASGRLSYESVRAAIGLAKSGAVDGLAMAPLTKQALHRAGLRYESEFEIFADEFGTTDVKAVVKADQIFRCTVVGHCAFAEIVGRLTTRGIVKTGEQLLDIMAQFGQRDRGIAVAALNPHAGEGGLFGDEEGRIIEPAIAALRAGGASVSGPCPADTVFLKARRGEVGGVVFLYHDQGNIAMKSGYFGESVLVYTNVPHPIASVGHGSALDIAGRGIADPGNMALCLRTLRDLVGSRTRDR